MATRKPQTADAVFSAPSAVSLPLCFFFCFAATLVTHATLLRLPYYWDEAGYYIPAAYDFFRTGTLIPFSTLTNAHPPGISIYLAALWKLFGFQPLVTRVGMAFASSVALTAVFAIAQRAMLSSTVAGAVVLSTALYPVWFAQATLGHADGVAAAATLWGLYFVLSLPGRPPRLWLACFCFTLAALTKEIAVGTPLALACWQIAQLARGRSNVRARFLLTLSRLAALTFPVLPLALWFLYHRWRTGFLFGNPEYLRYNATSTLSIPRFLLALGHRALHLTAHLNLFVPVLVAFGSLLLPPLPARPRIQTALCQQIWVVLLANAVLFSLLGGALLTRYLLPMYPLVLLLAVAAVYARFRNWLWFPLASAAAFLAGLLLPVPYQVAPEDTLAYADAIRLQQEAIDFVVHNYPHGAVLSAWPVTDSLRKPELGYLKTPLSLVSIDNFSLPALESLAARPASYSTAIVFSTKYIPAFSMLMPFRRWNEQQDTRYFAFHQDLSPPAVATLLHGAVVWQAHRGAEWAAVLRFDHPQLARFHPSPILGKIASYNGL